MARRVNMMGDSVMSFKNPNTRKGPEWHLFLRTRQLGWTSKYGWWPEGAQQTPQMRFAWPYRRTVAAIFSQPLQEMGLALDRFGRSLLPEEHKKDDGFLTHRRVNTVEGRTPSINRKYRFVAPSATVAGQVQLDDSVSLWYDAVVREGVDPEKNPTVIGRQTQIMDRAVVIGARIGSGCVIEANATVAEGATIGENVIIGARAYVESGAIVEDGATVGSGVTVPSGTRVSARTFYNSMGVMRTLNPEEVSWSNERWNEVYLQAQDHHLRSSMETHEHLEERYVMGQLSFMAERSKPMQEDIWQERKRGRGHVKY